ncbi:hypothetical protein [Derxia lacustris]|nr:hypothetical protein [Derxia lacustris]
MNPPGRRAAHAGATPRSGSWRPFAAALAALDMFWQRDLSEPFIYF